MYLRLCKDKGALPTKTTFKKISYKGAVVKEVEPSIYQNILVIDLMF